MKLIRFVGIGSAWLCLAISVANAENNKITQGELSQMKKAALSHTPKGFGYAGTPRVIDNKYASVSIIPISKDYETDVAYLKKINGKWVYVDQGTGIDPEDLVRNGIPVKVAEKIAE